jgi:hypothetical protein
MVTRIFIREQTMINVNAEPICELTDEELEKANGGHENISINFSSLMVTYNQQSETGAGSGEKAK